MDDDDDDARSAIVRLEADDGMAGGLVSIQSLAEFDPVLRSTAPG